MKIFEREVNLLGPSTIHLDSQVRAYLLWLKDRGIDRLFTPVRDDFEEALEVELADHHPNPTMIQNGKELNEFEAAHNQILDCRQCPRGIDPQHRCSPYVTSHESAETPPRTPHNLHSPVQSLNNIRGKQVPLMIFLDRLRIHSPDFQEAYELLKKMMNSIKLTTEDYLILPLTMCEQDSLEPTLEEVQACRKHSLKALELYRPRVVLTLGILSTFQWLIPDGSILSKGLPSWNSVRGRLLRSPLLIQSLGKDAPPVLGTFHPADLARFPTNKKLAWEDLKLLRRFLDANSH